ncbi:MAG: DUF190 domain-containing protein [Spirochaeta sp.]|jgi:PII-like signaling protein|nr:DUF190 domain-containing protein [Spirochaeta sp.]
MDVPGDAVRLTIYVGETDHFHGTPMYEAIVRRAREHGLAGATVLHGILGYGKASTVHVARILRLSEDLPVTIDIVDSRERIESFLPIVDSIVTNGLVTTEAIRVVLYRHDKTV